MTVRATAVLALLLISAQPADAYLHLTVRVRGETVRLRWTAPRVRWFATNRGAEGVSATAFQSAVARAFAEWEEVPTASIAFEFGGFTNADPFEDDDLSVLGFRSEPGMERVLGATTFIVDTITGEIVESDVFFNDTFPWSTSATGDANRVDLQSVATHEIGHFIGLGHSALGETEVLSPGRRRVLATAAVMFPIAFGRGNIADRELQPDDIAGVSDLYPAAGFRDDTGVARGRVTIGGRGLLGAHVVAFNLDTGKLIGAFALSSGGEFEIAGLTPGPHVIRAEPLDDADIESFFSARGVDVNFRVGYYQRLFVAPAGGAGERFDVTVQPK